MALAIPPLEELTFETAGSLLCREVPVARPDDSAAAVRSMLSAGRYDVGSHIAVCDERGRLRGLARIEDVLPAAADERISEIMDADPPVVSPGTDQEVAAWKAVEHGESALAVVDAGGVFRGMLPPARLLGVLLREHDEDMARLGGVLRHGAEARSASEEPVLRRLWHRLPWLFVGLIGALFAADLVGAFEERLEEHVLLAFFLPGIVYLADAVGTQTETLVIRGLSVGVGIRRVVARELFTGLLAGIILAAAFFPLGLWRWGEVDIAVTVSLALLAACSTATVVAMALPWAFEAAGRDPAFGSGPLATVVQDLLSILVYLAIASAIVA
jgi:magnesium transporter